LGLKCCDAARSFRPTSAHFSVSSTMRLLNWAGDPGSGAPPRSTKRALILGSASAAAAGGKADNQAHWPRRIGLRPTETRGGWQRGSACGEMQEHAAGKFLGASSPTFHSMTSSASASSVDGICRFNFFADFKLIVIRNRVGDWMGSSPGFASLKIRATYSPAFGSCSSRSMPARTRKGGGRTGTDTATRDGSYQHTDAPKIDQLVRVKERLVV
jgi:hypothetical protein